MNHAPLVVRDLRKVYRKSAPKTVPAVDRISFSVQAGECFGLLGPNGAGKSTTINCITGFYPPTSGEVTILGQNVHKDPKSARQMLGVCPQDDTLDTDFSVINQMIRHASFFKIPEKEGKRRAQELLKKFRLEDKAHEPVERLSGGMKRRLQVARALVSDPRVLVLDEPTTGLDPEARRIVWEILGEARTRGLAILLSTHYMDEAERLCDRIAILHQGRLLDVDTPANLIAKHVPQAVIDEEIRPGVRWRRPPNLEDVFLKLTGTPLLTEEANHAHD